MAAKAAKKKPAPKKLWKATLASCPGICVREGTAYAYLQTKAGFHFGALDAENGAVRWLGPGIANLMPAPMVASSGCVVVREHAPFGAKRLWLLDATSGELRKQVSCATDGPEGPQPAEVFGPLLLADRVGFVSNRLGAGPAAVAVDPSSGAVVWEQRLPEGASAEAALGDGERLLVSLRHAEPMGEPGAWRGSILALRAGDGTELWRTAPGLDCTLQGAAHGHVVADVRSARTAPAHTARGDHRPNELVVLDAERGGERFRRPMPAGWTSFVLADRIVCVEHVTDAAVSLDPTGGAEQWARPSPYDELPPGVHAPLARSSAVLDGELWLTGARDRIVAFALGDGLFRSTNLRGFQLAADAGRLFVGDSSSLTAYAVGGG